MENTYKAVKIVNDYDNNHVITVKFNIEKYDFRTIESILEEYNLLEPFEDDDSVLHFPEFGTRKSHPDEKNKEIPYFMVEAHKHSVSVCGHRPDEKLVGKQRSRDLHVNEGDECGYYHLFNLEETDYIIDDNGSLIKN